MLRGGRHDAFTLAIAHQAHDSDGIILDAVMSEKTKSEIYLAAIPVFTSKRIQLLEIEKMETEVRLLEAGRTVAAPAVKLP